MNTDNLEEAPKQIGYTLGIKLEPHESSYIAEYYRFYGYGEENFILQEFR